MDKRLCRISLDQISERGPTEDAPEALGSVLVGIALGCTNYLLPVAVLWIVTFTSIEPLLALALTFFIHSEIRHAQGRRRALRTRSELVSRLRQMARFRGESRHFTGLVAEISQRFHQLAFVEIFVAPVVSAGASAAIAVLVEMHVRFRLIDVVLPAFGCAAATFAWLRLAHWQVRSLLPTKYAVLTLLLLAAPFSAFAAAAGASRADDLSQAEGGRVSVTCSDRNSRTINKPANFGSSVGRVCLEPPPRNPRL